MHFIKIKVIFRSHKEITLRKGLKKFFEKFNLQGSKIQLNEVSPLPDIFLTASELMFLSSCVVNP